VKKILYIAFFLIFILGSFLTGSWYSRREGNHTGRSPISQTQTSSVKAETENTDDSLTPGTVKVSPERQQTIGIQVGLVEKKPLIHPFRISGRVAADETRIYRLNAVVDGWITKIFPNSTGSLVKKNEVLATFYSPEFLSAEQALIFALNSADRVQATVKETPGQKDRLAQFNINLQQYRDSLRNLGMGDQQIERLIRTRTYMENIDITSPVDSFILVRNLSLGQRFEKGTEWYRLADLSRVWILADVYGKETRYFKPGMEAKVILPDQEKIYRAKVSKVLPLFDASTRTLKVRLETDNPGFLLRPDMFVDVEFPVTVPAALTVPADALVDSGIRKTVYVDRGNGHFEPRLVETGWRMGNRVEITKGLSPGERIVTSGTFLIDSESRMEMAAQGKGSSMAKDPVSGEEVSIRKADKAGLKTSYKGKAYFFNSLEGKQKFDKNPESYVAKGK
jgi:membrane fusion protein, copper/silver efflux system